VRDGPASEAFDRLKVGLAQSHPSRRPATPTAAPESVADPARRPFLLYLKCEDCGERRTLSDPRAPWVCSADPNWHRVKVSSRVIP
jgi:hypothetical protein